MLKVSKLTVGVVLLCATSAHAVELPDRNAGICTTENSDGKCSIFGSQAEQPIASARAALAVTHGSAWPDEIKVPYTGSGSMLSRPGLQVGHERTRLEPGTAILTAHGSNTSSHHGKIETLRDDFKHRDDPYSRDTPLILAQADTSEATAPRSAEVPREQIDKALADLLADRESWGTEPSRRSAAAAAEEPDAASAEGEAPVTDLAEYLARRESWGMGAPPKPVNAPLAAGAVSPLPATSSAPASASDTPPVVHPVEETPVPQLTEVPREQIDKALADLLAERESWGTEPSSRSAAAAPAETPPVAAESEPPVTDLAEYLERRESWGTGEPPKPVNAPLAAGAVSPLPATSSTTAPPASDTPPVVHPVEETPVPQLTEVPRDQIDKVLADQLAERESWGTEPSSPAPEVQSADAAACEAELREALAQGTILFGSNRATLDQTSFTTLDQISERAQACENAFIIVEGHTDDIGSEDMNNRLSEQRATAVMTYLVEKGVDSSRIEAVGFGESRPLVPNTSNESRAKNRRIELRVR